MLLKRFSSASSFVHGKHINSVAADANAVLLMINKWFIENKLSLSLDKTCFSVFGCRNVDTAIVHFYTFRITR